MQSSTKVSFLFPFRSKTTFFVQKHLESIGAFIAQLGQKDMDMLG